MFGINKYLVMALVFGASVTFAGYKGYGLGVKNERSAWLDKEVIEISQAAKRTQELGRQERAKESLAAIEYQNIADKLYEATNELESSKSAVNRLANDITKLRFNIETLQAIRSEEGAVAASTRECDGETITELSPEVFRYVYDRFGESDEIVNQLSACQALLLEDRQTFND